jgi:Flp pilus assembly protein TadB
MNVLDGAVIGHNMQHHRHQEFIRFLNAVERAVPAGKTIHAILDNYAAHKHPAVRQCWRAIRDESSTSRRPQLLGSTRSRGSLPP